MFWQVNDDPSIVVRTPSFADVLLMGDQLRESDIREIAALSEDSPREALLRAYLASYDHCCVVTMRGAPVLMAGCAPHPNEMRVGLPWLLGTDLIYQNPFPRVMLEHGPRLLRHLTSDFDQLINLTADLSHQPWLRSLGFTVVPYSLAGRNNEPLFVFSQESLQCVFPSPS